MDRPPFNLKPTSNLHLPEHAPGPRFDEAAAIERSLQLAEHLKQRLFGLALSADTRTRASAILFGIAIDHQRAVVDLLAAERPNHTSAFALARPIFESCVRALWVLHAARDEQIRRLIAGGKQSVPHMKALIEGVERSSSQGLTALRKIYDGSWDAMSGFAHGGGEQLQLWSTGQVLRPEPSAQQVCRLLAFASQAAAMCGGHIVGLTGDLPAAKQFTVDLANIAPRYGPA